MVARRRASYLGSVAALLLMLAGGASLEASMQSPDRSPDLLDARSYKEMGDAYVADEMLSAAASAYAQALSAGRESFTPDERVQMAIYISWEDRLDEAIDELQLVLAEHPEHVGARSHLARVYSWSGELTRSIDEANRVLDASPDDTTALLVKANALEWKGFYRSAIPLYEKLLASDSEFDARIGLSTALLSGGNRSRAYQNAQQLSPTTTRQAAQADELSRTIRSFSQPRVDLRHNYYEDSDENQSHRYALSYGFGLGNHDFELELARTDSRGSSQTRQSRQANFGFSSLLTEGVSINAGVGVTQLRSGSQPNLMTGRFGFSSSVSNGVVGATVSSEVLTDTSELIDNRIRAVRYGVTAQKPVGDRVALSGGYGFRDMSDGNTAHDIQFAPEFLALFNPRIAFGYQLRFQDYQTQSQGGYFDPDNYLAHRFYSSIYHENSKIYTYVNAFVGRQDYTRNAVAIDDMVLGGAFSFGLTPTPNITIEVNAEGGNFAAGSVSGFTYFNLGSRLKLMF